MPAVGAEHVWVVPADHPAFAGHFPGRPILPGVMLLDRAILYAEAQAGRREGGWQIGAAKFFAPVEPGTELSFSLAPRPGGAFAFVIRAGAREVASGTLTAPVP
jgi:3-hydroxymyristoyl/3-hydroxydecanoyl-(acyl carrier protein) dehydratase